jgi:hypothetical protein
VDELPILTCLQDHFAKQCLVAFELAADYLSEEVNFWDEIRLGLEVLQLFERRQLVTHQFKYNSKYSEQLC